MSIIRMKKVEAIGMDTVKDTLIIDLMELGVVQLQDQSLKLSQIPELENIGHRDGDDAKISSVEAQISRAELALNTLEKFSTQKQPLFVTRKAVKINDFLKTVSNQEEIEGHINQVLTLNDELHKLRERINKAQTDLSSVAPWASYDLPLDARKTKLTTIDLGVVPSTVDVNRLIERVKEKTDYVSLKEINRDRELIYLVVVYMDEEEESVMNTLKQSGYMTAQFDGWKGMATENENRLTNLLISLNERQEEIGKEIAGLYGYVDGIQCLHDALVIERDRAKAKESMVATNRTFSLSGWMPASCEERVKKTLDKYQCFYAFSDPEEDEEVPVLVQNNSFFTPFESVMEMYSLPDYRGFDPTKLYGLFYAMFFGIMLSDAGYGLVITIACAYIIKKYPLEGLMYKMSRLFLYCGISTVFWGAMFGGWFGDAVNVVSKVFVGSETTVKPLWFNPIEDPTRLLIWSLAFGVIHLFLAMGINAYMLIKRGKFWSAVFDVFSWYVLIIGLVLMLAGSNISEALVPVGKYMSILGAAVILLTGGREKKGFGKVIGGLGAIYNITGYLSDILSYARLLALGLATGVIASVVNTMGSLGGSGIVGIVVFIVVFVIGHVFNLGINALGSFVHSSRLQYIEFFGKFFEDGGEEFNPFRRNTKYIKILNDNTEVLK